MSYGIQQCLDKAAACERMASQVKDRDAKAILADLAEHVADDYTPHPGGIDIDDDPTTTRQTCVITRGGGFTTFGDLARCRRRRRHQPQHPVGFRLAETPS